MPICFLFAEVALGEICTRASGVNDSCNDTYAYCGSEDRCVCKSDFYNNKGKTPGGVCMNRKFFKFVSYILSPKFE